MKEVPGDAAQLIAELAKSKKTISVAESCTGGLLAGALTQVPGASSAFYGGFITYADQAKTRMIGVSARTIRDYGAVSEQVARAMADGARNTARTDYAISVTGIAGPSGASERKPIGLVYIAVATDHDTLVIEKRFGDLGRDEIRAQTVKSALELALEVTRRPAD